MILSVRICLTPEALLVIEDPKELLSFVSDSSVSLVHSDTERMNLAFTRLNTSDLSGGFKLARATVAEIEQLPSKVKAMLSSSLSEALASKLLIEVDFEGASELCVHIDASKYFAPSTSFH